MGEGEEAPRLAECRDAAADSSARERESAQVERHADDVCAAFLLERELAERGLDAVFEGEVSGVIRSAAFVSFRGELANVYEGMLPARRLPGDRYELDRAEVALVGRGSGARLRLGDPISVRVAGVDAPRGRAEVDLAGELSE
jgi:ribonuclease R